MNIETYYYNCSQDYVESINGELFAEIISMIQRLPKRNFQTEINQDLFWLLTNRRWAYDSCPKGTTDYPPEELELPNTLRTILSKGNQRNLCETSTTLSAGWHADFAKKFDSGLVHIEVQFGTVESMFKDFCGFKIAHYERRLALGIEVVMCEPSKYFAHRKQSVSGMAYFESARRTLPAIALECPIWLIGIKE